MAELVNCVRCNKVFVKTMRDICQACYKQEEADFNRVYTFLKERENREAILPEIVEATGVEEKVIIKFIKEKRLRTSQFPKLAYPCEKCGTPISSGEICLTCLEEFKKDLAHYEKVVEKEKSSKISDRNVYYSFNKNEY